jgi:23S rRNA (pseudouridine1915-N3)-methyltransferase
VKLVVIAAGRVKEKEVRAIADDYLGRIRRYVKCDEIEVKSARELAAAVPAGALLVALEEVEGDAVSSTELSRRVERWSSTGKGVVAFIIGDADGIPKELSKSAAARISLSKLTLPHRLARVLLLEQLYRSLSILRGEPYARE